MKAERRHELEHNDLDSLITQGRKFVSENWTILAIAAAVMVLAIATYNLLTHERAISAPAEDGWRDFFYALSDKDAESELELFLDKPANKNSKAAPVVWAKLLLAERKLAEGSRQLFDDRKLAEENLAEAEEHFLAVEKDAGNQQELFDRARIGLAKVYESQNKPDDAVKQYDLVIRTSGESALGKVAARGKARLSSESNREFLAWFAQQKPFKRPPPGRPPATPLPEGPDFSIPSLESGAKSITPGLKLPGDKEVPPLDPLSSGDLDFPPAKSKPKTPDPEPKSDPEPKDEKKEEKAPE